MAAAAALLEMSGEELSAEERDQLSALIVEPWARMSDGQRLSRPSTLLPRNIPSMEQGRER